MSHISPVTSNTKQRFLTLGAGSIDPNERIKSGEISQLEIDQIAKAIENGQFYESLEAWHIPTKCVDGRSRVDNKIVLGSNAAGGTFSLVMADALTHQSYRRQNDNAPQHARRLFNELIKKGYNIGGHDDDVARNRFCGCGALDRLDSFADLSQLSILAFINQQASAIRIFIEDLGYEVDRALQNLIVSRAEQLIHEHYPRDGITMKEVFIDVAGKTSIETLHGRHNEVALVINTRAGTTINRTALAVAFGPLLQVFNLDSAAIASSTEIIALTVQEAYEKFIAALYYNVATAGILAGPSLRVIVR